MANTVYNIYTTELNCLFESERPALLSERPGAAKTPWRSLNLTQSSASSFCFLLLHNTGSQFLSVLLPQPYLNWALGPASAALCALADPATWLCSASYLFDHLPLHSSRAWLMFIEGAAEHVTSTPKHDLRNKIMRTSHYRQSAKPRTHGADIVICLFDVDFTL